MNQNRKRRQRKALRAGHRACALALSAVMSIPVGGALPAYAEPMFAMELRAALADREIDQELRFDVTGIEESNLQYAGTSYVNVDEQGAIHLRTRLCHL